MFPSTSPSLIHSTLDMHLIVVCLRQLMPPKPGIIRRRPSERAKRRMHPKAEFVVPAGDVIRGIGMALQSQRRLNKRYYGRPVSKATAATGRVKESRAVAEDVLKAVGRTRFTRQKR